MSTGLTPSQILGSRLDFSVLGRTQRAGGGAYPSIGSGLPDVDQYSLIDIIQCAIDNGQITAQDDSPIATGSGGGGGGGGGGTTITGQYAGSASTYALLPFSDAVGDPVTNGDWAILTNDDGGNVSGIYVFDGLTYSLGMEINDAISAAASTISPASDDATGAVGVSNDYARGDHKHPAQGVSGDAENLLKAGTDGLHMLDPDDTISTDAGNQLVKGTDLKLHVPAGPTAADAIPPASDDATGNIGTTTTEFALEDHKHPAQGISGDADNALTVGADGLHYYKANDRVFADDTTVAPASAGEPTEAEIATFAGTTTDSIIYYTGNDTSTDPSTYVFHIDGSGTVTKIESPSTSDNIYTADGTLSGSRSVTTSGNDLKFVTSKTVDTIIGDDGLISSYGFVEVQTATTPLTASTGGNFSMDLATGLNAEARIDNSSTGDIGVNAPTNATQAKTFTVTFVNSDAIDRNVVFNAAYTDLEGNAIGTVSIPAGTSIPYQFVSNEAGDAFYLQSMGGSGFGFESEADETTLTALSPESPSLGVATQEGSLSYWNGSSWSNVFKSDGHRASSSIALATGVAWDGAYYSVTAADDAGNTFNVVGPATIQAGEKYFLQLQVSGASAGDATFSFDSVFQNVDGDIMPDELVTSDGANIGRRFLEFIGVLDGQGNNKLRLITPTTVGASPYSETFDATTDWGAASGGLYTITVTQATHGKSATDPIEVTLQEDDGTKWISVEADEVGVDKTTGDVTFSVSETPDGRFAGRVIIR